MTAPTIHTRLALGRERQPFHSCGDAVVNASFGTRHVLQEAAASVGCFYQYENARAGDAGALKERQQSVISQIGIDGQCVALPRTVLTQVSFRVAFSGRANVAALAIQEHQQTQLPRVLDNFGQPGSACREVRVFRRRQLEVSRSGRGRPQHRGLRNKTESFAEPSRPIAHADRAAQHVWQALPTRVQADTHRRTFGGYGAGQSIPKVFT